MKLSFHGGVRGVTGSCFLLETEKSKVLIDCGMHQGERESKEWNFDDFNFDPKAIDAVVVTHAHYDHTGRVPLLVKKGFTGKIFMTAPTKALSEIILEDAVHVMAENAKRNGDEVLFDLTDVTKMLSQTVGINYHTKFSPATGVSAMFHDAGHILGSAFVTIEIENKKFLFSGDIGNQEIPILPETEKIQSADFVIAESTYGNRDHESTDQRKKKLILAITQVINRGGTLIIPAFSIERTQELLYEIDGLVNEGLMLEVPIYLDSPLAIKATEIYRHYKHYLRFDRPILKSPDHDFFTFPRLKETLNVDASKAINDHHGPKIIIAGSGMMTGGRVMHHLKRYLSDKKSGVLIIGYQGEGTLGRKIFNGAKTVDIHGDEIEIHAQISAIGAFSAHADRNKMAHWLVPVEGEIKKVFLVHGDQDVKIDFKKFLQKKIKSEIIIPEFWQVFEL